MSMNYKEKLENILLTDKTIQNALNLLEDGSNLYIVGGFIRDYICGKISNDKDLVVVGESGVKFAKKLADKINGFLVVLDNKFDVARIVMEDKQSYIDIAGCTGKDILEDLSNRDFTINAIAYELKQMKIIKIDPFNGEKDIFDKKIKAISENNLIKDPLRMLRAFRFASILGFDIEKNIFNFTKNNNYLINQSAKERINVELLKLLEGNNAANNLILMKDNGLLYEILPELKNQIKVPPNLHHHLCLIDHSIETVNQLEKIIPKQSQKVKELLCSDFTTGTSVLAMLKLACLLHDIGKPSTWEIDEEGRHRFIKHDDVGAKLCEPVLRDLKFSKNAIKYISKLVKNHIYPSQLVKQEQMMSEKAKMRFIRKMGSETPDVILLAMADRLSARGEEISEEIVNNNITSLNNLLEDYFNALETMKEIPKLLSGTEILALLNIERGPKLGKIISELKEAQIAGDVNTKDEAIEFVKNLTI